MMIQYLHLPLHLLPLWIVLVSGNRKNQVYEQIKRQKQKYLFAWKVQPKNTVPYKVLRAKLWIKLLHLL